MMATRHFGGTVFWYNTPMNVKGGIVEGSLASLMLSALACCLAWRCCGVTYTERLDFFNRDNDIVRFYKTAKILDRGAPDGIEVESERGVFDMVYDIHPGKEPIPGFDGLELESASDGADRIELSVKCFPDGPTLKFMERWAPTIRFKTNLDPSKRYQVRKFRVLRAKGAAGTNVPWRVTFKSLTGVFTSDEANALRFEVATGNPFHCVRDEAGETARLLVRNVAQSPISFRARLGLSGPFAERIPFDASGTVDGDGTMSFPLPETSRKGVWIVSGAVAAADGSTNRVETRFARMDYHARTPKVPRGRFRMGINYHMARYPLADQRKTLDALVATGAKLARAGIGLAMRNVQAYGPDEWNWGQAERRLSMLEDAGIAICSNLFPIPDWAARPELSKKAKATKQWRWEALSLPGDRLFERYCEKVAAHFRGRLDYYEIGNEWDLNFLNPVAEAVEIQRQAYRGIKRADPDVPVLPNGWTGANDLRATRGTPRADFQKEFLMICRGDCYDVHTTHCHGDFASYERRVDSFRKLREETGTRHRPWFSNESAISSCRNERGAAATVWKKVVFARARGSVDYIWYNLRGTGWNPNDPEQGFGMISAGYMPRETFVAFAALATVMRDCDSCSEVWRRGRLRGYELRGSGGIALVAWDDECAARSFGIAVETDAGQAECVDMFGNRSGVPVTNGVAVFAIGNLPSALVLKGARRAVASAEDIARDPLGAMRVKEIAAASRDPAFTLSSTSHTTDFYEAIPGKEDRLWKGEHDLSANVWLARESTNLFVRVDIRDDVHVAANGREDAGDSVQIFVRPGASLEGHFLSMGAPVSRTGDISRYEARFPFRQLGISRNSAARGFYFNLQATDDDGKGPETVLELEKGTFGDPASGKPVRFTNIKK